MTYLLFKNALQEFEVFSTRDIMKCFPEFDSRRLVEWQHKGYIRKLINKWYVFADIALNDGLRYRISNCLHRPSYVSLESALSHHGLIPEAVYSITNITTKKTVAHETPIGTFHYSSIKPALYFGYYADRTQSIPILIAEPEKAILDYLYLGSRLNTIADLEGLRLNKTIFENNIDQDKLNRYANCFESATLNRRLKLLKQSLSHVDIS